MEKREGKSNVQRKEIIGRGIVKIYYSNNPERRQFSPIIDKPFNLFVRSIDNFYDKIYPDGAFVRGPQGQKKYLHVGGIPYKIWFYTAAALAAIMLALCSFGSIKIILKILTYTTVKQEKNYVIKDELRDIIVGEYIETTIRYQDSKPINIWIEKGGQKALPDDNDIHRQWFFEDSGFSVRMERKKAVITLAFAEVGLYNLVVGFQRDKHMVFKRFNVLDWCCRLNNISTNKWVISIPNGVRKITGDAFVQDCRGARKVIIPESVTEIDVRISKYLDLCEVLNIPIQ